MSNLPDGVSQSMIPGYNSVEAEMECKADVVLPVVTDGMWSMALYARDQLALVDQGKRSEPPWEQVYRQLVANLLAELNEAPGAQCVCPFDGETEVDGRTGGWVCPVCCTEHEGPDEIDDPGMYG